MQSKTPAQKRPLPIIRVFVSSTFSDLKHERNALHAKVWPELEHYCQQPGKLIVATQVGLSGIGDRIDSLFSRATRSSTLLTMGN